MSELLAGEGYIRALIWTLAALALLLAVLFAVRMIRGFGSGTLIAGGRNRVPRLAVVDAAAVDNQRRLVLVRRDDVEHLILIGGPSDLVIEQQIRSPQAAMGRPPQRIPAQPTPAAAARRPAGVRQEPVLPQSQTAAPSRPAARAAPEAPRYEPAADRPSQSGAAASAATPPLTASREPAGTPQAQETPVFRQEHPQAANAPFESRNTQPQARESEQAPRQEANDQEAALLRNIDLSIDEIRKAAPSPEHPDESIENEMSRLLDDLSNEKKS